MNLYASTFDIVYKNNHFIKVFLCLDFLVQQCLVGVLFHYIGMSISLSIRKTCHYLSSHFLLRAFALSQFFSPL